MIALINYFLCHLDYSSVSTTTHSILITEFEVWQSKSLDRCEWDIWRRKCTLDKIENCGSVIERVFIKTKIFCLEAKLLLFRLFSNVKKHNYHNGKIKCYGITISDKRRFSCFNCGKSSLNQCHIVAISRFSSISLVDWNGYEKSWISSSSISCINRQSKIWWCSQAVAWTMQTQIVIIWARTQM